MICSLHLNKIVKMTMNRRGHPSNTSGTWIQLVFWKPTVTLHLNTTNQSVSTSVHLCVCACVYLIYNHLSSCQEA